jgi:hypothetical protein
VVAPSSVGSGRKSAVTIGAASTTCPPLAVLLGGERQGGDPADDQVDVNAADPGFLGELFGDMLTQPWQVSPETRIVHGVMRKPFWMF